MLTEYNVVTEGQHFSKFFPPDPPNKAFIQGILERKIYGKIWLNEKKDACLITTNSFSFMSGNVDDHFLEECLKIIPRTKDSLLVNCSDSYSFPKNLACKIRVYYSGTANDILDLPKKIDDKIKNRFQLANINEMIFDHCHWKTRFTDLYQSKEQFLKFGYGSVLLEESKIVAELYGIIGKNCLEAGAFIHEGYRGHGLLLFMIAHSLKQYCRAHQLFIHASCDRDHRASEKSIIRFGLKKNYEYPVLDISKLVIAGVPISSRAGENL